jgi:hypothetical protein
VYLLIGGFEGRSHWGENIRRFYLGSLADYFWRNSGLVYDSAKRSRAGLAQHRHGKRFALALKPCLRCPGGCQPVSNFLPVVHNREWRHPFKLKRLKPARVRCCLELLNLRNVWPRCHTGFCSVRAHLGVFESPQVTDRDLLSNSYATVPRLFNNVVLNFATGPRAAPPNDKLPLLNYQLE